VFTRPPSPSALNAPQPQIDPGFRRPVVYLTWGQNDEDLTRDMVYLQPKEGWAMSETSCNMASSSIQSSTMDEYVNMMRHVQVKSNDPHFNVLFVR
jgi:hypothetical protein